MMLIVMGVSVDAACIWTNASKYYDCSDQIPRLTAVPPIPVEYQNIVEYWLVL